MWELYEALCAGDLDLVRDLLDCGLNPNEPVQGSTPLVIAAWENHSDLIEALLAAGADPNFHLPTDQSPLYAAHDLALTRRLIAAGARVPLEGRDGLLGGCSLHAAASRGDVARLQVLLDEADGLACLETYNRLGWTPVGCAAAAGQAEALRYLLGRGADPDGCNEDQIAYTPLAVAAKDKHVEAIQVLLEFGANPDHSWGMCGDGAEYIRKAGLGWLLEPKPNVGSRRKRRQERRNRA